MSAEKTKPIRYPIDKIKSGENSIIQATVDYINAWKKAPTIYDDKAWLSHLGVGFSIGREYVSIWVRDGNITFSFKRGYEGYLYRLNNKKYDRDGNYASGTQYAKIGREIAFRLGGKVVDIWNGGRGAVQTTSFQTNIKAPKILNQLISNYDTDEIDVFGPAAGKLLSKGSKIHQAVLEKAKWNIENYPPVIYTFDPEKFECNDPVFKGSPNFMIDKYRSMFKAGVTPEDYEDAYNRYKDVMHREAD